MPQLLKPLSLGVALLLMAGPAASATPFPLKGLEVGQNVSEFQKVASNLRCEAVEPPLTNNPAASRCTTTGNLTGMLSTFADQPIEKLNLVHDERGVVHSFSFSLYCGADQKLLENSIRAKFGKPTEDNKIAWVWKRGRYSLKLILPPAGASSAQYCHSVVSVDDGEIVSWLTGPAPKVKLKISNDL